MKYVDTPIFLAVFSVVYLKLFVQPNVSSLLYVLSTVFDLLSTHIVYVPKINFNVILLFPFSALEMAVFHKVLPLYILFPCILCTCPAQSPSSQLE